MNYSKKDRFLLMINKYFLIIATLVILLPLFYVILASFLEPNVLLSKGISFNPDDWSVQGYVEILQNEAIIKGFFYSILYSVGFALATVIVSILEIGRAHV